MIDLEAARRPPLLLEENRQMKKLMSVMLGLSLITGAAAVAFGQDTPQTNKKNTKKKKKKKEDTVTNKRA